MALISQHLPQSETDKAAMTAECLEQIRKAKVYCVENLKKLREENGERRTHSCMSFRQRMTLCG